VATASTAPQAEILKLARTQVFQAAPVSVTELQDAEACSNNPPEAAGSTRDAEGFDWLVKHGGNLP
jgi:hypothetical protein